ncbi:MAG: flagellar hook-basal body protein [Deltaproteobacteria bacterium]|nr:flagellar hook-basal body protein [Deltaproteobacteria bacterium]
MLGGMIDVLKGCLKEEIRMGVLSNNLSNSNVVGFKKEGVSFSDMLSRIASGGAGAGSPDGATGTDQGLLRVETDFSQGDTRSTGNALDFAIAGKGFFKVVTPEGIRYTRKGNFYLDSEGFLITADGDRVAGKGGPIQISGGEVHADGQGVITVDGDEAGQLDVVDFEDYKGLLKEGDALFRNAGEKPEIPVPVETRIEQESLEFSNVEATEEMIKMIQCLRAFESYQKAIQTIDNVNSRVVNEVSRLR